MSMIGNFKLLSPDVFRRVIGAPSGIVSLLDPDEDDNDGAEAHAADLDIDKAWHGLHFLLTGTAWGGDEPLNFISAGGVEIGEEDVGYGPARGFDADQVKAIHESLEGLTVEELRSRFDPNKLAEAEVYPDIWQQEGDEAFEYLAAYFERLRDFLAAGAKDGMCLLVYLD